VIGTAAVVGLTIKTLAYLNHAVLVPQNDFYGVNNYDRVRVTNVNRTTIINNYQAAPVVNTTIIKNIPDRSRYTFSDVRVADKPHQSVLKRIERNQAIAKEEGARVNARSLRQNITRSQPAALPTQTRVLAPKVTNRIVPITQVNQPASEIEFKPRDLKERPKRVQPRNPGMAGQPAVEPVKDVPGQPGDKARRGDARQAPESDEPAKSSGDKTAKPDVAGPMTVEPGKQVQDKRNDSRREDARRPAESDVTPKSPTVRAVKPDEAKQPVIESGKQVPDKAGNKARPADARRPAESGERTKSPADRAIKTGEDGSKSVVPAKEVPHRSGDKARRENTRRPAESDGPSKAPADRAMKQGEAGPKAVGFGREPLKEQKRVTPAEPAKSQMQEERRPGRQQPQVQDEPQAQQQRPQLQQSQSRRKPPTESQPKQEDDDDKEKLKEKGQKQQP
jgi:hypothetical protein